MHFCTPVKVLQRTCRNLTDNLSHLSVRKPQSTPSEMLLPGGCHSDRGQRSHLTKLLPKRTHPPPAALPEEQGACFNSAVSCVCYLLQHSSQNLVMYGSRRGKKKKTIITCSFFSFWSTIIIKTKQFYKTLIIQFLLRHCRCFFSVIHLDTTDIFREQDRFYLYIPPIIVHLMYACYKYSGFKIVNMHAIERQAHKQKPRSIQDIK